MPFLNALASILFSTPGLLITGFAILFVIVIAVVLLAWGFRAKGFSPLWFLLSVGPLISWVWVVLAYVNDLEGILTLGGVDVHSLGELFTAALLVLQLLGSKDASVYAPYFADCLIPLVVSYVSLIGVLIFDIIVLVKPSKVRAQVEVPAPTPSV